MLQPSDVDVEQRRILESKMVGKIETDESRLRLNCGKDWGNSCKHQLSVSAGCFRAADPSQHLLA